MIKDNFKPTFQKAIENYLLSACSSFETVIRNDSMTYERTNCILYTRTGIENLNIDPDTYVGVEYFDNPSSFGENSIFDKYNVGQRIIIFLNIENKKNYKKQHGKRIRLMFLDDLNLSIHRKPNEKYIDSDYRKSKCININNLNEYVKFVFRVSLLLEFFRGEVVAPYIFGNSIDNKTYNDVFPFRYEISGVNYIFYENKNSLKAYFSKYIKGYEGKVLFEQVSIRQEESINGEKCLLTITERNSISFDEVNRGFIKRQYIAVSKVTKKDLITHVDLFTQGGEYDVDDFHQIYKYRSFAKRRYMKAEESVVYNSTPTLYPDSYEICIGSRNAIEQHQIWFSTYNYLNDPFDLVIRKPRMFERRKTLLDIELNATSYSIDTDSGIAVFCSTTDCDNILMWAHYADSGEGMCAMYYQNELIDMISNDSSIALCLYGPVLYSQHRQTFSITASLLRFFSYDFLTYIFNIANLFSKYTDWQYEKERRFIVFPQQFNPTSFIGYPLTLRAKDFVFGIKFPLTPFSNYLSVTGVTYKSFSLSDSEYKLI